MELSKHYRSGHILVANPCHEIWGNKEHARDREEPLAKSGVLQLGVSMIGPEVGCFCSGFRMTKHHSFFRVPRNLICS